MNGSSQGTQEIKTFPAETLAILSLVNDSSQKGNVNVS